MSAVLYKYRNDSDEYLIYDRRKNDGCIDARKAKFFFSQNFGLGATGLLEVPEVCEEQICFNLYTPDGKSCRKLLGPEQLSGISAGSSEQFGRRFLLDEGYLSEKEPSGSDISYAGKVFVFAS